MPGNEELEAQVRAALVRAKSQGRPGDVNARLAGARRAAMSAKPSKATRATHAKLLLSASSARWDQVVAPVKSIAKDGGTEEELVVAFKDSINAYDTLLQGATAIADNLKSDRDALRRENRKLRDQLGDVSAKKAKRREAGALIAKGAVTVNVIKNDYVRADVRDGPHAYHVERYEKEWSCSCPANGECRHVRSVMLLAYRTAAEPTSSEPDAKTLAESGAVWVRLHEPRWGGLAEVVDGGKAFTVARQGFGGYSCTCGSMNAKCRHGGAVRFVVA